MFWARMLPVFPSFTGLPGDVTQTPLANAYVGNKKAMTKEKYEALEDLDSEVNVTVKLSAK